MASNTYTLVSDICQVISDWRGESTADTSAGRIRAISRAEQDFALRKLWRTHRVNDAAIVAAGTATETIGSATLPMRTKGLTEFFVGGTTEDKRYAIVDFNAFKNLYNNNNTTQMVYEYFDVANNVWKVKINPTPTASLAITYSYYYNPPVRTLTTEKVLCDNPLIVAHLALADIYGSEEELEKQQIEQNKAEELIGELEGYEEMPAINQLYIPGAIENQSRSRGIGSY